MWMFRWSTSTMFKSLKKIRSEMNRTTFLINVPVDASIEKDRGGVWDWFVLAQVGGASRFIILDS